VYPLTVISYDRWGVANPVTKLAELTLIDPCNPTTITAPAQVDYSYILDGGNLNFGYTFVVSPSSCPITFDTAIAPVTTTLQNAVTVSNTATTVSYTVNSTDRPLDGVYNLTVITYDRRGAALATTILSELTLIDPCKLATITLANKYFLDAPAISHSYTLSNAVSELLYEDGEAIIDIAACGDLIWTFYDTFTGLQLNDRTGTFFLAKAPG